MFVFEKANVHLFPSRLKNTHFHTLCATYIYLAIHSHFPLIFFSYLFLVDFASLYLFLNLNFKQSSMLSATQSQIVSHFHRLVLFFFCSMAHQYCFEISTPICRLSPSLFPCSLSFLALEGSFSSLPISRLFYFIYWPLRQTTHAYIPMGSASFFLSC